MEIILLLAIVSLLNSKNSSENTIQERVEIMPYIDYNGKRYFGGDIERIKIIKENNKPSLKDKIALSVFYILFFIAFFITYYLLDQIIF